MMTLRKLESSEHGMTRALWEAVFASDTKAFLDYYYKVKTAGNQIYAAFDGDTLCGMLQLNPYSIMLGEQKVPAHYIIAVATDTRYRKQGIMRALLTMAANAMRDAGEPFTFLMPAAEAIYYPYGFRYVYKQNQGMIRGEASKEPIRVKQAGMKDCASIAAFVTEQIKGKYSAYAVRNKEYYETLLAEQQSEQGGILISSREETITGCCLYAKEENVEIREPIYREEYERDFLHMVWKLAENEDSAVPCLAYGTDAKPMIMARILHLENFLNAVQLRENMECRIQITDEWLEGNEGTFLLFGKGGESVHIEPSIEEGDFDTVSISALTSYLFGYKSLEDAEAEEQLTISKETKQALYKLIPLSPVFLNEIV